jgi:NADPH-dependent curcumin reductase CurA
MTEWHRAGKLRSEETTLPFEQLPDAFIGLFTGRNVGKMVVHVGS